MVGVSVSTKRPAQPIAINKVHSIVSNRTLEDEEQYLVRWKTSSSTSRPPLSWHEVHELRECLEVVQEYLELWRPKTAKSVTARLGPYRKRKAPDSESGLDRLSPFDRHDVSATASSSEIRLEVSEGLAAPNVYNGKMVIDDRGFVFCRSTKDLDVPTLDIRSVHAPASNSLKRAVHSTVNQAQGLIRRAYLHRISKLSPQVSLVNDFDQATPSLRFHYVSDYVLAEGVFRADPGTREGCQKCSPQMGRNIGCEYTQRCSCLEYAAVNVTAIRDEDQRTAYYRAKRNGETLVNYPKRFPYFAEGVKKQVQGTLVAFYLDARHPIYECNENCRCGPYCRNRVVQHGRKVELEIFRTGTDRGWGLRCKQDLAEGQFVDTYRGEIVTDAEATRREDASSKNKASYLYSLDKFAESEGLANEDLYVVDGEFMGGPSKFMNHSCDPNCRQYVVSYNKHDPRVYDIAFFTCRKIEAGEELTFDYLDKEETEEEIEEPGEGAVPCLCGAGKCRKWLWT